MKNVKHSETFKAHTFWANSLYWIIISRMALCTQNIEQGWGTYDSPGVVELLFKNHRLKTSTQTHGEDGMLTGLKSWN